MADDERGPPHTGLPTVELRLLSLPPPLQLERATSAEKFGLVLAAGGVQPRAIAAQSAGTPHSYAGVPTDLMVGLEAQCDMLLQMLTSQKMAMQRAREGRQPHSAELAEACPPVELERPSLTTWDAHFHAGAVAAAINPTSVVGTEMLRAVRPASPSDWRCRLLTEDMDSHALFPSFARVT